MAWAELPALAGLGRRADADQALADAARHLESDPHGDEPGRFGFDHAEFTTRPDHTADLATMVLDRIPAARYIPAATKRETVRWGCNTNGVSGRGCQ